jgi:hypothetical protein
VCTIEIILFVSAKYITIPFNGACHVGQIWKGEEGLAVSARYCRRNKL